MPFSHSNYYGNLPLHFEINHGQVNKSVKFLSRGKGYTLFLTSTEAVLVLKEEKSTDPKAEEGGSVAVLHPKSEIKNPQSAVIR